MDWTKSSSYFREVIDETDLERVNSDNGDVASQLNCFGYGTGTKFLQH